VSIFEDLFSQGKVVALVEIVTQGLLQISFC